MAEVVTEPTYDVRGRLHHKLTTTTIGASLERGAPSTVSDTFVLYFSNRPVAVHTILAETAPGHRGCELISEALAHEVLESYAHCALGMSPGDAHNWVENVT